MSLTKMANAIHGERRGDRIYSYILLGVVAVLGVLLSYIVWGFIFALTNSLESIATDFKAMRSDINVLTHYVQSMEKSIDTMSTMSTDTRDMSNTLSGMSISVENIDTNIKGMEKDMVDMNKMNPMKLF